MPDRETEPELFYRHLQRYIPDTIDRIYEREGPNGVERSISHLAKYYGCSFEAALTAWSARYGVRRLHAVISA